MSDRDTSWFVSRPRAGWTLYTPSRRVTDRYEDWRSAVLGGFARGATVVWVTMPVGETFLYAPPAGY